MTKSLPTRMPPSHPVVFSPPLTTTVRPISRDTLMRAQITVNVPAMGDSITEGTIVEWCASPGSHVGEGDVLALIETDKVTIDIKAEQEGVLVTQLGAVDEEVEVGAGLYVLDTDVANVERVALDANVSELNAALDADAPGVEEEKEGTPALPPSPTPSVAARVPSIHFLGKEGWRERLTISEASAAPATISVSAGKPHAPTSVTHMPYSSMYGRPPITEEEMEALVLGGAEEAPEVRVVVSEKDGLRGVAFVGGRIVTTGPRGVWLAPEY